MRVAFLSPSLSRSAGGIFEIERCLAQALQESGLAEVEALGLADAHWAEDCASWRPVTANSYAVKGPSQFGYSPGLRRRMLGGGHELLHLHALWMYTSVVALEWRRKSGGRLVVTPNGMLEPWALRNSHWKKVMAGALYERRMLALAAVLQANTAKELRDIRLYGLKNPVAVIPNGVTPPARIATFDGSPRLLVFLGRLHPKKGLRELIDAWARLAAVQRREWRLVLAGWDDGGHEAGLKQQAVELGMGEEIKFVGSVFKEAKEDLLASASAFVLPSFSEGLPMAVLEAWSYGLPVVMTEACNLPEGFAREAAVRVAPEATSIAGGLYELMGMSVAELQAMGRRGRQLVEEKFAWPEVAGRMAEVYRWVLGGGAPPACVQMA